MKQLIGLLCITVCITGCFNMNFKNLTIYNASEEAVYLKSIKGTQMYEKGSGPQNLGEGRLPPNFIGSWTTYQTVLFTFPIEIQWSLNGKDPIRLSEFDRIVGLKGNSLTRDGNILLVFETNKIWSLSFEAGRLAPSPQELERKYKGKGASEEGNVAVP